MYPLKCDRKSAETVPTFFTHGTIFHIVNVLKFVNEYVFDMTQAIHVDSDQNGVENSQAVLHNIARMSSEECVILKLDILRFKLLDIKPFFYMQTFLFQT